MTRTRCGRSGSSACGRSASPLAHRRRRCWCRGCWTDCVNSANSTSPPWPAWQRTCASASPKNWPIRRGSRMAVPLNQVLRVGAYVMKQHLLGRKRYPLVLMLEPLFRCNLACAGCGKIDYPPEILNQRLSVAECLEAVDECGAPVVSIAGGEPLLHREMPEVAAGIVARKKFVYLCTNALLLEKKMHLYTPNPYFQFSVHLDGDQEDHDRSVCQDGVYERAVEAIKKAKAAGFRVSINTTLFDN